MKKIGMLLAAMAVVAALATACGGSGSSADGTTTATEHSPAAIAGPTLTIANMAFGQPLTVAPGTEITIVNNDGVEHSVTSKAQGAFDVHVDGGGEKTLTAPTQPGQYQFYCVYHPSMKGTLIVS
ncbi:MAG TPA: cupredoxin domain-containing protein [Mycobacterium sp.]|nr:cupredoxin domain-containing protein [Mycobacterium sp.]